MASIPVDIPGWDRVSDALISNAGIGEIVREAGKMLGNPCFVSDSRFRVLARYQDGPVDDELWSLTCKYEMLPPETIMRYDKAGISSMATVSRGVQEVRFSESSYPWLGITIGLDESHIAFFGMILCNGMADEGMRRGFAFASRVIACELRKASYDWEGYRSGIERFLHDAISGAFASRAAAEDAAVATRFTARPDYQLLVVRRIEGEKRAMRDFVRFQVEQVFGLGFSVVEKDDLVFLMSHHHRYTPGSKQAGQIEGILRENGMRSGVSSRFSDIMDAEDAFREALTTVDLAMKLGIDEPVLEFHDRRIYPFSGILAGRYDIGTFVHPSLRTLEAYDEENGGCLVDTLACFFRNGHSVSETARELFLHRNTVDWRLRKIERLLGGKLSDANLGMVLWLSLQARELLKGQ